MSIAAVDPLAPAGALLAALRERRVSAVELLDLQLARIRRFNPALNAIIAIDKDGAREAAQAADAARARGEERALLGLPVTVKDAIDLRGFPTTAGVPRRKDHRAVADAPVVARLREAGAVVLGKTNTPPYTGDWQTDNPIFGRSNNPWDLSRTPGGSTGGGAAAVAAGLTALELGSDIGGSVRMPAAFCGIYGHRPSDTALPRSGQYPGSPLPNVAAVLNVIGPLARAPADLDLALATVAGPEAGEDAAWLLQLPAPRHEQLGRFRVAILPWLDWLPVAGEVRAAVERVAAALRRAGAVVETAQPEGFGDLRDHQSVFKALLGLIFAFNAGIPEDRRRATAEAFFALDDWEMTAQGNGILAGAYEFLELHRRREEYRAAYREFFRHWDIMLAPIAPVPAFPHMPGQAEELSFEIQGQHVPYWRLSAYPGVATLSGQPATAFPAGMCGEGLPVGLQAIGPYLEDRTPIRFTELLAEEMGGFQPPPGYM